jgi:hypothetical protein
MPRTLKNGLRKIAGLVDRPPLTRRRAPVELRGLSRNDPGIDRVIEAGIAWLGLAQDRTRSRDGGVARYYNLIYGWDTSYPETTGYIVPTLLAYAEHCGGVGAEEAGRRARRMLDWLVSIQFRDGGFQGGAIGATPKVPVTFNTGQVLLGLAAGVRAFGDRYRGPMRRAADWLVKTQDPDGCWRRYPTPFAAPGEKAYETHVAWGLLEAARVEGPAGSRYADAALANVRWALRWQAENGWFEKCCLNDADRPLTHTIGYVLRGLVEAYRFTRDPAILDAAVASADGLLTAMGPDGYLPGRLTRDWHGAVQSSCLTGTAQIACCWLLLYESTGRAMYLDAARAANLYVRRTIDLEGPVETRGAVMGSFPVDGDYCPQSFPNWACKFVIDSNLLERRLMDVEEPSDGHRPASRA